MAASGENADQGTWKPRAPMQLDDFLPFRINVLAETVREPLLRFYLARFEVGVPEWRIVVTLAHNGVLTAKDLGRIGRMHKTKVSRALALLESRGFVSREVNMADLRESFVSLTPDGLDLYARLIAAAEHYNVQLGRELSDCERERFDAMLVRLQARADILDREWNERYQADRTS